MGLTCECGDDYEFYYTPPEDYTELKTSKRKRCVSCNNLIDIGSVVTIHYCWRSPNSEIEEKIHGDEVAIASKYHCEECADIEFNLTELGFCINLGDSMNT